MRRAAFRIIRLRWIGGVSVATLLYTILPVAVASATIFSAAIINDANTFSSGSLVLDGTTGSGTCVSASGSVDTNSAACAGNPLPIGQLSTTPTSGSITLSAGGTLGGSSGSLSSNSCGAQYAAVSTGTDTAIAYGGLAYQTSGPLGGNSVTFDGASGAFNTINSYAGLNPFTLVAWFRTTASGSIMGFSNSYATTGAGSADRMIWVDSTGHVVAGVGTSGEISSPATYNNGAWHFVVATLYPNGKYKGFNLYVDGALVASNSHITSAQRYTGYWHIGWSGATGWTNPPTSAYFGGSLAGVGVIPTALTATQVSSLYSSANFITYSSNVMSYGPTAYWTLNDSGANSYTGAIPGVGASSSACGLIQTTIQATVGASSTCVAPSASGSCPSPSGVVLVNTIGARSMPAPSPSSSVVLTTTMDLASAAPVNANGLRLLVSFGYAESLSGFNAQLSYPVGVVIL